MVLVVMPLNGDGEEEEAEEGREVGRSWLKTDANRGPIRGEARMAVIPAKRSTAKRPKRRRDKARMPRDLRRDAEITPDRLSTVVCGLYAEGAG
jgi:hypothetical protein